MRVGGILCLRASVRSGDGDAETRCQRECSTQLPMHDPAVLLQESSRLSATRMPGCAGRGRGRQSYRNRWASGILRRVTTRLLLSVLLAVGAPVPATGQGPVPPADSSLLSIQRIYGTSELASETFGPS